MEIRQRLAGRRLLRPYHELIAYGGPGKRRRARAPHIGRRPLPQRPLCHEVLANLPAQTAAAILKDIGIWESPRFLKPALRLLPRDTYPPQK